MGKLYFQVLAQVLILVAWDYRTALIMNPVHMLDITMRAQVIFRHHKFSDLLTQLTRLGCFCYIIDVRIATGITFNIDPNLIGDFHKLCPGHGGRVG